MRLADATRLSVDGQDAVRATLNGQEVWSSGPFDPLADLNWVAAAWAEDPAWPTPTPDSGVGWWRRAGVARPATSTHLDSALGMYVPGAATFAASVDHQDVLNIAGDLEFVCLLRLDDYTPATVARGIVEKRVTNSGTATLAWETAIRTDGTMQTIWHEAAGTQRLAYSTAPLVAPNGTDVWYKTTIDADNGGVWQVRFFQAPNVDGTEPTVWTEIGVPVNGTAVTNIRPNTSPISLGVAAPDGASTGIGGYLTRAILRNGIDGTEVLDVDFRRADTYRFTEAALGATVKVRSNVDLNQSNQAKQPLWRQSVAALNGRPAFDGDGVDDYLVAWQLTPVPHPYTLVAVIAGASPGSAPVIARQSTGWAFYWDSATTSWRACASGSPATILAAPNGTADNGTHLMRFLANGASSRIAEDETVLVTGDAGSNRTADALGLFDVTGTPTFPFGGQVAFAGLYPGDVTTAPRWSAFLAWAETHYGLAIV